MPGIPTGRGCDACRKQKKKCIFDEADAVCSRCARLEIECIGLGQRRFMFKEEYCSFVSPGSGGGSSSAMVKSSKQRKTKQKEKEKEKDKKQRRSLNTEETGKQKPSPSASSSSWTSPNISSSSSSECDESMIQEIERIMTPPNNHITTLAQALVTAMAPETDLRYNLKWAYSGYLGMIPCRLGYNDALDTAADALVKTHRALACGGVVTIKSLTKYSQALGALRKCLDDPLRAGTSETLCAVTLLLIVQSMQDPLEHKRTGHAEGAARILKARKHIAPRDDFESLLLLSLRGVILFEGLFNPRIDLTPQEWKDLVERDMDSNVSEGKMLHCLARIPNILHRASNLNSCDLTNRETDKETMNDSIFAIQEEIEDLYATTRAICDEFRARPLELEAPGALHAVAALHPLQVRPVMLHAHYQRTYGFAIIIALYLNYILVGLGADTDDLGNTLKPDAVYLAQEMLDIAENAVVYRPFGAVFVPLGLVAARMAVGNAHSPDQRRHNEDENRGLRNRLKQWYLDYQMDFNGKGYEISELHEVFRTFRPLEARGTLVE
ncbi:hypothetical protein BDV19DRAFT_44774 [Aspergillus venezuelensis]